MFAPNRSAREVLAMGFPIHLCPHSHKLLIGRQSERFGGFSQFERKGSSNDGGGRRRASRNGMFRDSICGVRAFPIWTSYGWVLMVFFASLAVFHVLLIFAWPLGKTGWKKVDYIWLSMGFLGVFAGVASTRQTFAQFQVASSEAKLKTAAGWIQNRAQFGVSVAVCGEFIRSVYSPPKEEFERIQREYDQLCKWFKAVNERLPREITKQEPLSMVDLGGYDPPRIRDSYPVESLQQAVNEFNLALALRDELRGLSRLNDFEFSLTVVGPFLIAIAIALRMTKVTGEIRLG
jgi:hypothetical protein